MPPDVLPFVAKYFIPFSDFKKFLFFCAINKRTLDFSLKCCTYKFCGKPAEGSTFFFLYSQ